MTATPERVPEHEDLDPTVRTDEMRAVEPRAVEPRVAAPTRRSIVREQRSRYGRVRWGSAFFGWLTAVGTAVLLGAVAAAVAGATGFTVAPSAVGATVDGVVATGTAGPGAGTIGLVAALAVIFLAYVCGGYVAGRMARFSGAKQGAAVWLWSVVVAIVVGLVGIVAGTRLAGIPVIDQVLRPVVGGAVTTPAGLLVAGATLAVALVGAMLGGLGGMAFHRRVDRTGLPD